MVKRELERTSKLRIETIKEVWTDKINPTLLDTMNRIILTQALAALLLVCGNLQAEVLPGEAGNALPFTEQNPVVTAIMSLPQETPEQQLHAIVTLIDLGEAATALPILETLTSRNLDQPALAALVHKFGSHRMLQLSQDPVLSTTGAPFAESCLAAVAALARDPARLNKLINQLSSDVPEERQAALVDLGDAGTDGVIFLVETLAREKESDRRRAIMSALARMQPAANRMLLATLSTNNPQLFHDAATVLLHVRDSHAMPLLMGPMLFDNAGLVAARQQLEQRLGSSLTPADAEQLLAKQVERYTSGVRPFSANAENEIELWHWDDKSQKLSAAYYPAEEASTLWAARLAENLYRLNPANNVHRQQCVVLGLEAAKLRQGYDKHVKDLQFVGPTAEAINWASANTYETNEVLSRALKAKLNGAAVAACQLLGQSRDLSTLDTFDGRVSALVEALKSPARRVRFAALEAILAIDPSTSFAGSSHLAAVLDEFARSSGKPSAIVAMASLEKAASVAGLLNAHGYSISTATTGQEIVRLACEMQNLQFIVVDMSIVVPPVRDVLVALRSQPETAGLPIALLAPAGLEHRAWQIARSIPCVAPFSRPHSELSASAIVEQMNLLAGRDATSPAEREAQALFAVQQFGRLLDRQHSFYQVRRFAPTLEPLLYDPALSTAAMESLAMVGTPASQAALLNLASQLMMPLESRQAASKAFANSTQQFGVLLPSHSIWQQYERYNSSETADTGTQLVLGELLDTLEGHVKSQTHNSSQHGT